MIYEHGLMGGGASASYQGSASGVALDLVDLKGVLARAWGPEKFRTVFGEDASAADVQVYQVEQQEIADRKAQNEADAAERAAAPERERLQAAERAAAEAVDTERIRNVREAEQHEKFERTTGAGVSANPIYQAFLDTQEGLPAFEYGNAPFLGRPEYELASLKRPWVGSPTTGSSIWSSCADTQMRTCPNEYGANVHLVLSQFQCLGSNWVSSPTSLRTRRIFEQR
ncbi:hypothetical protein [Pseudomonas alabamensis]|uniref:hypothetical protein n=1 Tax=Pseudomonas alabamensis TaxID=3064349 RepID=UPI003F651D11